MLRFGSDIVANSAYGRSCGQQHAERTGPITTVVLSGRIASRCARDRPRRAGGRSRNPAGATGAAASSFGRPTRVVRSFGRAPTGRGLCGARASRSQCRTSASVARSIRHRFVRPGRIVDRHTNRLGEPAGSTAAPFDSRYHIRKKLSSSVLSDGKCHVTINDNTSVRIYRFIALSIIASIKPNSHGLSDNE